MTRKTLESPRSVAIQHRKTSAGHPAPCFQAHSSPRSRQFIARPPPVRQREQHEELGCVLGQSAIAHFDVVKLLLGHPKRIFLLRPDARLEFLDALGRCVNLLAQIEKLELAWTHQYIPRPARFGVDELVRALGIGIPEGVDFFAVKRAIGLDHVIHAAGRAAHGMHESRFGKRADAASMLLGMS